MKSFKIFFFAIALAFCLFTLQAVGQSDVVTSERFVFFGKCKSIVRTVLIHDTVVIIKTVTIRDTVRVPYIIPADTALILSQYCDTINIPVEPVDTDTLFRALYLNGFYNIVGNTLYENALLYDLKRWKFNATYAYDLSDVLSNKSSALSKLHKRMRTEAGIKEIGAARGNSSSCIGAATTFNKNNPDSSDFDTWNLEFEPWNAYPKATSPFWTIDKDAASSTTSTIASRGGAWDQNKIYLQEMKAGQVAGQVDNVIDYFGWFKEPFMTDAPKTLVALTDYLIVHMYYSSPDFGRSKSRCDELDSKARR